MREFRLVRTETHWEIWRFCWWLAVLNGFVYASSIFLIALAVYATSVGVLVVWDAALSAVVLIFLLYMGRYILCIASDTFTGSDAPFWEQQFNSYRYITWATDETSAVEKVVRLKDQVSKKRRSYYL